jgi:hypothetical protein
MSFPEQHELHKRRFGRNLGLGLTLIALVVLIFGLTMAKQVSRISNAQQTEQAGD